MSRDERIAKDHAGAPRPRGSRTPPLKTVVPVDRAAVSATIQEEPPTGLTRPKNPATLGVGGRETNSRGANRFTGQLLRTIFLLRVKVITGERNSVALQKEALDKVFDMWYDEAVGG